MTNQEFDKAVGKIMGIKSQILAAQIVGRYDTSTMKVHLWLEPTEKQEEQLKQLIKSVIS